jgi:large subunit ribosomal protein L16
MLAPKRIKWRRRQKGRVRGKATRGNRVAFGQYGLQTLESAWITARQIEAARVAMTRHIRRGGKVFIRVFPDKPTTKKPAETRMGKGKGSPEAWVAVVKPGRVMFELEGVSESVARRAMELASAKLPVKTRIISRASGGL